MGTVANTLIEERPGAFERERDAATIRYLEEIGLSGGWRCLEVGGGAGTIAEWMCLHRRACGGDRPGYGIIGSHRLAKYRGTPSRHRE